jgi:DNA polymerase IV (DinB-like DNA polymerase)
MPVVPRLPGVERSDRTVCHVDVDCFYAACERLREPALEGEPLVVGMGYEPGETHGAVATASYEAREHGVESAMAISEALERLPRREDTPEASEAGCYRPVDMAFYESVGEDVRAVLRSASSTLRAVSIDEAYLAVDELAWSDAESFGRSLKREIESEVGVVASVGIAPGMTTAKLASDADKPDGLVVVDPDEVRSFLAPIEVEELHGVGPVTASKLREMGFRTAGDIAEADVGVFTDALGDRGRDLHRQARGEDEREVEPTGRPKSLSRESSLVEPTTDIETKRQMVRELASEVAGRAEATDALYRTIGIKAVTPPFDAHVRSRSLSGPIDDPELVERISVELLGEFESASVRKLGVRLSNLAFDDREQATISEWGTERDGDETRSFRTRSSQGEQTDLSRFE